MSSDLSNAVALLQAGELVAFPTETVYGLGADAAKPEAVAKIFAAKGRPADHPLIVHLPGAAYLERWAIDIPSTAWALAEAFWPGPLTLILKRHPDVPYAVTGGQDTVGVRVPSHPLALDLLRAYAQAGGGAQGMCGVAAPSANKFGRISPTDAAHVRAELGEAVSLVLDGGACTVGIESTIIDLSRGDTQPPRLLRPGHITPEQIALVIGILPEVPEVLKQQGAANAANAMNAVNAAEKSTPRVSGALDAHYAPLTPLRVVPATQLAAVLSKLSEQGQCAGLLAYAGIAATALVPPHALRQLSDEPEAYARGFYAALRELDQAGNDVIIVEALPDTPAWSAVADRLRRAAYGSGVA